MSEQAKIEDDLHMREISTQRLLEYYNHWDKCKCEKCQKECSKIRLILEERKEKGL